ncbi:MAG: TetR/AcrR family transcriptional regulator [Parabacteroides sp.]|nr:TetR/AcrR family transcriptional regulator [Parabacteroides sp.]
MEQPKNRRNRRTRAELEADVFDAVRQLASEKGLAQISFTDITQRAGIQMSVLLNNYKNMERVLDKYAYISDYWLHDLFDEEHPTDKASEDILKSTLKALAVYLYDNLDMQHLLVWELEADNPTTRRMARSREKHYRTAIEEYSHLFEDTGIPIDIIAGLLTAGTYYLILHRRRSTFWGVDYQRRENRERLYTALDYLCGLVFNALEERNKVVEIARRMKKEEISDEVIVRCTELPEETVAQL